MDEFSLIKLIVNASLIVQMVMLLLLLISIYSWVLILYKSRILKTAKRVCNDFEERFWKGKDLNALYSRLSSGEVEPKSIENIFVVGYLEFARLRKQPNTPPNTLIESTQRAMRVGLHREIAYLDLYLAALATIGSVSPYIGLFGTVWGIMYSFHALADVQHATLAMVAPGISEALIATAMGLFAAIPAVMAYNHYVDEVDRLITRYDTFLDEFTGILQRQTYLSSTTVTTPVVSSTSVDPNQSMNGLPMTPTPSTVI